MRDAQRATKKMKWVPNPGPQTAAFLSEADELFYGGQAGGGKSDLGIGLALTQHHKSLILREYNEDARSLGGRLIEIVGDPEGWNGQILRYQTKERTVEFGGCKAEDDKQRYKGDPHDLICVGINTPVLMGDETWKPVQSIRVGDVVMTLEGGRKVTKAFSTPVKKSVKLTIISDAGAIYEQIQSSTHKVLTHEGWASLGTQEYLLRQGDAGQRNPINLLRDAMDKAPKHSRHIMSYVHPYTKDKRQSFQRVSYASWSVTPVDDQVLYDLEIEEVNHFITYGGVINQNCYDEVGDFTESQYTFIGAWNRSTKKGQRCRILATGNPPTRAKGLWVIERWAAWLDPNHPNPAKDGELRWYLKDSEGREREMDGPGPHRVGDEMIRARSRTFIRARLSDNPDLAATDYDATLAALPPELRSAYREGRFDNALKDASNQVIPTDWIRQAQQRWQNTRSAPKGVPMCTMGVDMSGGGEDPMIIALRYDGWYAPLIEVPGRDLPMSSLGRTAAGIIISHRRDAALVVIDMGGGYGGSLYEYLTENRIEVYAYKGAEATARKSREGRLKFVNTRSAAYWMFREALDPGQPGGSDICLPDDPKLVADLTTPTFEVGSSGIKLMAKESVVDILGRSSDRGDAVVMAHFVGAKKTNSALDWLDRGVKRLPKVIMGRKHAR